MAVDKTRIVQHCVDQCEQKRSEITTAVRIAEETILNDTKSSMGDKYETSREMAQQELNRLQKQANQISIELSRIRELKLAASDRIVPGSLIETNQHTYFIAISLGAQNIDGRNYMIISPESPIGGLLFGKKEGDSVQFRDNTINILQVT
ncbi:MAG: GreA/GreB family elongation factor [Sphingobacterium sp.]